MHTAYSNLSPVDALILHKPTGKTYPCTITQLDCKSEQIQARIPWHNDFSDDPEMHPGQLSFNHWDKFISESSLHFSLNTYAYISEMEAFAVPFITESSRINLKHLRRIPNTDEIGDILFIVPHLELSIHEYMQPTAKQDSTFNYRNLSWEFYNLHENDQSHSIITEHSITQERLDKTGILLRNCKLSHYESYVMNLNNICWIISLWCGRYISWSHALFRPGENCDWAFHANSQTARSDFTSTTKVQVLSSPSDFIETIAEQFDENDASHCYTIHWITRALSHKDSGCQSMILSMVFERLVTALYCGHTGKTRTNKIFFTRATYFRDAGKGNFDDVTIDLIIKQRNSIMHGSDNVYLELEQFRNYLDNTIKIVYAAMLALLGYKKSFSIRGKHILTSEIYSDIDTLSHIPLNFNYR